MNPKITSEQTRELFLFCRKHFVYHYDVQLELVDHLASSIENEWEKNPDIPFDKALQNTFGKFGVTGFSKVKVEKENALHKKYRRILWKYLLEFYRWPKIMMTIALTLVLFTLFRIVENGFWVIAPYFVLLTTGLLFYYYKIFPKKYKIETKQGKSFMLLNELKQAQFSSIIAVQIPIQSINIFEIGLDSTRLENPWILFAVSLFIISFTILLYGELFYVPQKIKEHFIEQFGEFAV